MQIMIEILDTLLVVLQSCLIMIGIFEQELNHGKRWRCILGILFGVGYCIITAFMFRPILHESGSLFIALVFTILLFEGKLWIRVVQGIISYMIALSVDSIAFLGLKLLFVGTHSYNMLAKLLNLLCLITGNGIILLWLWKKNIDRNHGKMNKQVPKWIFLLTVFFSQLATVVTMLPAIYTQCVVGDQSFRVAFGLFVVITLIIGHGLIRIAVKNQFYELEKSFFEKRFCDMQEYYEQLAVESEHIRRFQHDYKNHITSIKILLDNNQYDKVRDYLEQMTETVSRLNDGQTPYVGNDYVNAILNNYEKWARAEGIHMEIEGMCPPQLHISEMDLCILFSNALSNAIEAAQKSIQENPKITVHLKQYKNKFILEVENPHRDYLEISDNSMKTTKQNKIIHGYGIANMKYCIRKYHGTLEYIQSEKNRILLRCMMQNEPLGQENDRLVNVALTDMPF